jgi:hypothetical protein
MVVLMSSRRCADCFPVWLVNSDFLNTHFAKRSRAESVTTQNPRREKFVLQKAKAAGAITDAEYQTQKTKLVDQK